MRLCALSQFVDTRYAWCQLRSLGRAEFAELAAAFPAAAAERRVAGRAAFVEVDLLQARPSYSACICCAC